MTPIPPRSACGTALAFLDVHFPLLRIVCDHGFQRSLPPHVSDRAVSVLGAEAQPLDEPLDASGHRCRPKDAAEYISSKQQRVQALARQKRIEVGATWCVCENGATGPTFAYPDLESGFTAVFISGPVERGVLIRSPHGRREENMWGFTRLALEHLAECIVEAREVERSASSPPLLIKKEDRFGGVEVAVRDGAACELSAFVAELRASLEEWRGAGKQGIWLKLEREHHAFVSPAVAYGFSYHHATPESLVLTRWLPSSQSPLPRYAFTLIGVGGVVVNTRGEVLLVQERVSPSARTQVHTSAHAHSPRLHAPHPCSDLADPPSRAFAELLEASWRPR